MATSYESLLPEILPMVAGCPDSMAENAIRSAVIELCEKSGAYQAELDPVTTVASTYEYDLEAPNGTTVHKIMWASHIGKDLEPISTTLLEQREPNWRDAAKFSTPKYFVKQTPTTFWLVPVPSETKPLSTILRVQLKPSHTSAVCDDGIMSDYRDTIVNGAIFRLLRIPNKDWSDLSGAQIYAAAFAEGIRNAEIRAKNADAGVARKVNYGGLPNGIRRNRRGYRS